MRWMGRDTLSGALRERPSVPGLSPSDIERATAVAMRYGFHATMCAPFFLRREIAFSALRDACARLCSRCESVSCTGLVLKRLGRCVVALCLERACAELNGLAFECTQGLSPFRAPVGDAERVRRRAAGLSETQEANLLRWGYPYIGEDFHFHMTLTGILPEREALGVERGLGLTLVPLLPTELRLDRLSLMGEDESGMFHVVETFGLGGALRS